MESNNYSTDPRFQDWSLRLNQLIALTRPTTIAQFYGLGEPGFQLLELIVVWTTRTDPHSIIADAIVLAALHEHPMLERKIDSARLAALQHRHLCKRADWFRGGSSRPLSNWH